MADEKPFDDLLPSRWKQVLDKKLEFIKKDRGPEREFEREGLEAEEGFVRDFLSPLPPADDEKLPVVSEEAKAWFKTQKAGLEATRDRLMTSLKSAKGLLESKQRMMKAWETDLKEFAKRRQGLREKWRTGTKRVEDLEAKKVEAERRGFAEMKKSYETDLAREQDSLSKSKKDESLELDNLFGKALDGWRSEREGIAKAKAQDEPNGKGEWSLQREIDAVAAQISLLSSQEQVVVAEWGRRDKPPGKPEGGG